MGVETPRKEIAFERPYDILSIVGLFIGSGVLMHVTIMLFAGDWDFWTDWKDRQFWPLVIPFAGIIVPAMSSYITWTQVRLPIGATVTATAAYLFAYGSRVFQFGGWVGFPLNFVWPSVLIPGALVLDILLLRTRSFLLTGVVGGFLFGAIFLLANWPAILPFWQPVESMDRLLTVADLQGFEYLRTQTHEYLRVIEPGNLRIYAGDPALLVAVFAGFISIVGYAAGLAIGRVLMVGTMGKVLKKLP